MKISEFVKKYISEDYKKKYKFSSVYGEVKEVFEARSLTNLKEELNDVCFTLQSWLFLKLVHNNIKADWTMIWFSPSIIKMQDRLEWWTKYFDERGLTFKLHYWKGGSNYKKPHKIQKALDIALAEQEEENRLIELFNQKFDNFYKVEKESINVIVQSMKDFTDGGFVRKNRWKKKER